MLEALDLTVGFGSRAVLHGLTMVAPAGSITAIVGPNGSGKTTLLRALTGDVPYGGHIRLNGIEVSRAKPWVLAAMRAVLAQATDLAFPFTVAEVVGLGLRSGLAADRDDLPDRALRAVGLAGYGHRPFADLSGGQQQRAHLARVMLQVWEPVGPDGPRWLFLDEPVSSLDIGHQLLVMRLARQFADAGGGVVAVLHDLNLTAMFADRVALLDMGRLTAFGAAQEVLTSARLSTAYDCTIRVNTPAPSGPWLVPQAASRGMDQGLARE